MDATKLTTIRDADGAVDKQAVRTAVAEALRDLADEIERGVRVVNEINTVEAVTGGKYPSSQMFLRTQYLISTDYAPPAPA